MLSSIVKSAPRCAVRKLPALRASTVLSQRCYSTEMIDDEYETGFSLAFSDEQNALKELARSFALNEMIPVAAKFDQTMEFPREVFNKAWEVLGPFPAMLVSFHILLHCVPSCLTNAASAPSLDLSTRTYQRSTAASASAASRACSLARSLRTAARAS